MDDSSLMHKHEDEETEDEPLATSEDGQEEPHLEHHDQQQQEGGGEEEEHHLHHLHLHHLHQETAPELSPPSPPHQHLQPNAEYSHLNAHLHAISAATSQQLHLQQQLQQQLHPNSFPFNFQPSLSLPPSSTNGSPGAEGAEGMEDSQHVKPRAKRKQVKSACLNCRKRKTGCDSYRPCGKCVRNGLESSCVDVPRKKRSSNRNKTNISGAPGSSSSSPSSSPAIGMAQPSSTSFAMSPHAPYMGVSMSTGTSSGVGQLPQHPHYQPHLFPMAWANGQTQLVPMTWEEITKHVASGDYSLSLSAQNSAIAGNIALVPPEIAWKGNEGLAHSGVANESK